MCWKTLVEAGKRIKPIQLHTLVTPLLGTSPQQPKWDIITTTLLLREQLRVSAKYQESKQTETLPKERCHQK